MKLVAETGGLNITRQKRAMDLGCRNVEVWRGGAEENLLIWMRKCEIFEAMIRRDCLFLCVEIKEEPFLIM